MPTWTNINDDADVWSQGGFPHQRRDNGMLMAPEALLIKSLYPSLSFLDTKWKIAHLYYSLTQGDRTTKEEVDDMVHCVFVPT
jgi:hypothetical protein